MRAAIIDPIGRVLQFADQARADRVAAGQNVDQVVRNRWGEIIRIELMVFSDDSRMKGRTRNPQRLTHKAETRTNPRGVWEMRRLGSAHPDADAYIRAAYRGV